MGVERIALLKYNIPNLRYLYENDLRFLTQYRWIRRDMQTMKVPMKWLKEYVDIR